MLTVMINEMLLKQLVYPNCVWYAVNLDLYRNKYVMRWD